MTINEFEQLVQSQREVSPSHYTEGYFAGGWRADGEKYDLETRRRIEGKHPQLIQDVFHPATVLDAGCGPGYLMLMLHELGIIVSGFDITHPLLAVPALENMMWRADIASSGCFHKVARSDLVICREVLEHLTVQQIRYAVRNLVLASRQYIYVTTRFHPNPTGLLDVATSDDLDSSHITLLTKDFLRMLFVLEGCRSRHDLEERMDWQNKGRCLVMETTG